MRLPRAAARHRRARAAPGQRPAGITTGLRPRSLDWDRGRRITPAAIASQEVRLELSGGVGSPQQAPWWNADRRARPLAGSPSRERDGGAPDPPPQAGKGKRDKGARPRESRWFAQTAQTCCVRGSVGHASVGVLLPLFALEGGLSEAKPTDRNGGLRGFTANPPYRSAIVMRACPTACLI